MFGKDGTNKQVPLPPMPKLATILSPIPPKDAEEQRAELVKYAPKRHEDTADREMMSQATAAYDRLRIQLEQQRQQNERQRDEIGSQKHRIELLEHALSEAKNRADEYRVAADEAKAQTAEWKAFFANIKAVFNRYELPEGAPRLKKVDAVELVEAAAQLHPEQNS